MNTVSKYSLIVWCVVGILMSCMANAEKKIVEIKFSQVETSIRIPQQVKQEKRVIELDFSGDEELTVEPLNEESENE